VVKVTTTDDGPRFVARRSERNWCLLVLYTNDKLVLDREVRDLSPDRELQIGRAPVEGRGILADGSVSSLHASIRYLPSAQWQIKDEDSHNKTFVAGRRISQEWTNLSPNAPIVLGGTILMLSHEGSITASEPVKDMEGDCYVSRRLFHEVRRAATSQSTVLLTGETGVGKDLCARAVHAHGPRSKGPFLALNCGALAPNLIESELFGHTKNAFTGAGDARKGLIQQAHGGTLFLDEVGEMPVELQTRLLRVLETKRLRPVGSTEPEIAVDIRIVAATNRDLESEIGLGRFRRDLYHRLLQIHIKVPSLGERRADIPRIAARFLGSTERWRLNFFVVHALLLSPWSGNVRELYNFVSDKLRSDDELVQEEVDEWIRRCVPSELDAAAAQRVGSQQLIVLLTEHRGNVARVAVALGCSPKTVRRRCIDAGIDLTAFRAHAT
jgi:DNA-binding NtrC family response regulator